MSTTTAQVIVLPVARGAGRPGVTGTRRGVVAPSVGATADARVDSGVVRAAGSLRLTRRGRLVVWGLAGLMAAGVGLAAQSAAADGPKAPVALSRHVVAPGDTLWEIASSVAAPGEDVREVVARLAELNGLDGADLVAGQEVLLPVP